MNLNYLWFLPIIMSYIGLWIAAIVSLKNGDNFGDKWISFNVLIMIIVFTIIGLTKIL